MVFAEKILHIHRARLPALQNRCLLADGKLRACVLMQPDCFDDIGVISTVISKAVFNPFNRAGTGNTETVVRKIEPRTIVQVHTKLRPDETGDFRILLYNESHIIERFRPRENLLRYVISNHVTEHEIVKFGGHVTGFARPTLIRILLRITAPGIIGRTKTIVFL